MTDDADKLTARNFKINICKNGFARVE
jgi:hypothetical protein